MKKNTVITAAASVCVVAALILNVFAALNMRELRSLEQAAQNVGTEYFLSDEAECDPVYIQLDSLSPYLKETEYPEKISDKLKEVYTNNNDVVGWLRVTGTGIDTVVLQSDDNDYYLRHDYYKKRTGFGNLFLDYRVREGRLEKNSTVYGHTTFRGTEAFRELKKYKDPDFFAENPVIYYSTLGDEYVFKIFGVFLTTTVASSDNGYIFNFIYPAMSETNMTGYLDQVSQRVLYETGVDVNEKDTILSLSTCDYDFGRKVSTRLVVVARLLREGETADIDPTLIVPNDDYRRPQIWYSKNGLTNPYKNAEKWYPSAK